MATATAADQEKARYVVGCYDNCTAWKNGLGCRAGFDDGVACWRFKRTAEALTEGREEVARSLLRELTELRRLEALVRAQLAKLDEVHDPCGMRHLPPMTEETEEERFKRLAATRCKCDITPIVKPEEPDNAT